MDKSVREQNGVNSGKSKKKLEYQSFSSVSRKRFGRGDRSGRK